MRFQTTVLAAVIGLAALSASGATAQDRNVMIHNNTGTTLYRFYSTNSGSTKWGKDVMGQSVLPSGRAMRLNFDNKWGYCEFDFRAVFEDGTELTRQGVNVCEVSDYTYNP